MTRNTEATRFDRLRIAIGVVLAVLGVFTLTVLGAIFTQSTAIWIVGFGFLISGILISKSTTVANIIQDLIPH